MPEASEYENMMVEKYLKESIITHAQIFFGKEYPGERTWSVIFAKRSDHFSARVVVSQPDKPGSWKVAVRSDFLGSAKEALEVMLDVLQKFLGQSS